MSRGSARTNCGLVCELLEARVFLDAGLGLTDPAALGSGSHGQLALLPEGVLEVGDCSSPAGPQWRETCDLDAADTTNADQLWDGGALGLDLDGTGLTVGMWDEGHVLTTHQEFSEGRVTIGDLPNYLDPSGHATHVAGIIGAEGVDSAAKGVAPGVNIISFDWEDDMEELSEYAGSLVASNHCLAYTGGWTVWDGKEYWSGLRDLCDTESSYFGKYTAMSSSIDATLYDNPGVLSVWAAGNMRDGHFRNLHGDNTYWTYFSYYPYSVLVDAEVYPPPPPNGNSGTGFDSVTCAQVAKNNLVVGAIDDITDDPYDGDDVTMTCFSSWGPTDDGRIRPDVVGDGVGVYSAWAGSDTDYATKSGTSTACPNVTGTAVLLIQHYDNVVGEVPLSATMKALLCHTAFDAGNVGPDYAYGWGVVDAAAAATLITDTADSTPSAWIKENTYSGSDYSWEIYSDGTTPLKATIVWTDPAGAPQGGGVDYYESALVNDLDLWVTGSGGTYYPWSLDRTNPSAAATRTGANHTDNIEQVRIDAPSAGTYTIHVGRTGDSFVQNYSLVLDGAFERTAAPTTVDLLAGTDTGVSSTDDLTKLDNSTANKKLQFEVGGTISGATVTLYADGTEIGTDTGNGATLTITTDGAFDLTDGETGHIITARQEVDGKLQSAAGGTVTVKVDTAAPSAPAVPNLQADSDSGVSQTDEITNDTTPTFDVTIGEGLYYRFFDNTTQLSEDYATAATYTPSSAQSEGDRSYRLQAVDAAGNVSSYGTTLPVRIDTTSPVVNALVVNDGTANRSSIGWLDFQFGDDGFDNVDQLIDDGHIEMVLYKWVNSSWTELNPSGTAEYSWEGGDENTARWDLWFHQDKIILQNGDYAGQIIGHDLAGNEIDQGFVFYRWEGDISGVDRSTDILDLGELANNYGHTGSPTDFLTGDGNLDGKVDVMDLGDLATNYGNSMPSAPTWP